MLYKFSLATLVLQKNIITKTERENVAITAFSVFRLILNQFDFRVRDVHDESVYLYDSLVTFEGISEEIKSFKETLISSMHRIKTTKECNAIFPENRLRIAVKTIVRMALRKGKKESRKT